MNMAVSALLLLGLSALSPASIHQDRQQSHGTIILNVVGFENDIGDVQVGLFNSAESFTGKNKDKFAGVIIKIQNKTAQYVFPNAPYGDYAIKVFHDKDGDGQLNTNFFGIPTEKYGFSNNAKALFGPPNFDKAKFIVSSDTVRVKIDLH